MRLVLLCCVVVSCPVAMAAPPAWVLEVKPAQRIEATMTVEVRPTPEVKVREWVFAAGEAPELPSQTNVSTRMTPTGSVLKEVGGRGRGFVVTRLPGTSKPVTVTVRYEATLMARKLVPAGTDEPDSGHHHLLIDTKVEDYNAPVSADAQHIHYGKAQTEGTIELSPGKHTLQDVFADKNHIPHEPPVQSDVITITVE